MLFIPQGFCAAQPGDASTIAPTGRPHSPQKRAPARFSDMTDRGGACGPRSGPGLVSPGSRSSETGRDRFSVEGAFIFFCSMTSPRDAERARRPRDVATAMAAERHGDVARLERRTSLAKSGSRSPPARPLAAGDWTQLGRRADLSRDAGGAELGGNSATPTVFRRLRSQSRSALELCSELAGRCRASRSGRAVDAASRCRRSATMAFRGPGEEVVRPAAGCPRVIRGRGIRIRKGRGRW